MTTRGDALQTLPWAGWTHLHAYLMMPSKSSPRHHLRGKGKLQNYMFNMILHLAKSEQTYISANMEYAYEDICMWKQPTCQLPQVKVSHMG